MVYLSLSEDSTHYYIFDNVMKKIVAFKKSNKDDFIYIYTSLL